MYSGTSIRHINITLYQRYFNPFCPEAALSKMEPFDKIVNDLKTSTICEKGSILEICSTGKLFFFRLTQTNVYHILLTDLLPASDMS